jgi:protein-L-isoaspartate(D-aspartate) O-methyltransferase
MDYVNRQLELQRERMVDQHLSGRGIDNPRVLEAFRQVPREHFVPASRRSQAYEDQPIPIGEGQTISQPYIVALMLEHLDPQPTDRVLDVGMGSGYQTALLANLVRHVYAIERISSLADRALDRLGDLGIDNVTACTADGTLGWPEEAPFEGIISGAGAPEIPSAWQKQLADGGRLVLPVGRRDTQVLLVIQREGERFTRREVCGVRFVKLIGKQGWPGDRSSAAPQ